MSKANTTDAALERVRVRLQQLQGNHQIALREINAGQPLTGLAQLQSNWNTLQDTLMKLVEELKSTSALLETNVIVPNAHFPKQSKAYLDTLLRTKYDPSTEDWVEQKLKDARQREDRQDREKKQGTSRALPDKDLSALWRFAAETANGHALHQGNVILAQADYTWDEVANGIDNVNHGLERELREPETNEDSEEEIEEEEDSNEEMDAERPADKMDIDEEKKDVTLTITRQPFSIDSIQRLMARGECQHEDTLNAAKSTTKQVMI